MIARWPHYSKSQIFVQKFNLDKTPTFSRVFHANFFWQFFSWNQSCQQLKCPIPQHFHEFFTQKIDNFLGKSKLNFWTKNEDFEQCGKQTFTIFFQFCPTFQFCPISQFLSNFRFSYIFSILSNICQKFNFDFPRKLSIFWLKNTWKCCGFGLFSCWQL